MMAKVVKKRKMSIVAKIRVFFTVIIILEKKKKGQLKLKV